jgi:three-Cys-motif partner protein
MFCVGGTLFSHSGNNMTRHEFGGDWTTDKLDRITKYLGAYTTIFRNNPRGKYFTITYVDAFAGTGHRSRARQTIGGEALLPEFAEKETQDFLKGSAYLALEVEPSFHKYIFVERDAARAKELEKLKTEFSAKAHSIQIETVDANQFLRTWCTKTNWKRNRAVVFLDPYGMQVDWSTVQAIARTQSIDLWILFPMAVIRLLTKREPPPQQWAQALTRLFGTDEWLEKFYPQTKSLTLWAEEDVHRRQADFDAIGEYFVRRLEMEFAAVAPKPLPLLNSKNVPLYLLCFAAGNPKGAPIAVRIADYILRR